MRAKRLLLAGRGAAAGALLVAAMTVGCSEAATPVAPSTTAVDSGLLGDPSLGAQIAAVREATAQFHDVNVAIAAGYPDPTGRLCDQTPAGGMGIHSGNFALMAADVNPLVPEVLLYEPKNGGGFRLVGVEYIQFVFLRNPTTGVVAPWTASTPWPTDYQVVTPTPQLFGQTFQGPMPGHIPGMPWHWDLHAWIWANNPSGMFAQWNPTVSCQ